MPAATAILDRFLQDAELIQITGKSYRLRRETTKPRSKPARPDPRVAAKKQQTTT
jgi:hypothetical protein